MRGLWLRLTGKERWDVACKTVEHLKEHGDRWKLNEVESPVAEAHSTPCTFTEAHHQKQEDVVGALVTAPPSFLGGIGGDGPIDQR